MFGKYNKKSVTHYLERIPQWNWTFRPTDPDDHLKIDKFIADNTRIVDGEPILPDSLEIARRELAITFKSTNIPLSDKDPTPILREGASIEEVEEILKQMPHELLMELWTALGKINPWMGPEAS